tara:strand:+ start:7279 stop:7392 length:114 start_codon:yes stop_codon:yes gene_type:complete
MIINQKEIYKMKDLFIKEAYPGFEKTAAMALSTDSTK